MGNSTSFVSNISIRLKISKFILISENRRTKYRNTFTALQTLHSLSQHPSLTVTRSEDKELYQFGLPQVFSQAGVQ
jgi:hypothetical protein